MSLFSLFVVCGEANLLFQWGCTFNDKVFLKYLYGDIQFLVDKMKKM